MQDYRHLINRRVRPYIGELRLQAMSPARLTKLYRELTLRVYAHVISDQLTEAADIFARAVAATN